MILIYFFNIIYFHFLAQSLRTSTEDDSDMAAYIQRLSPSASEVSDEIKPSPMFSLPQVGWFVSSLRLVIRTHVTLFAPFIICTRNPHSVYPRVFVIFSYVGFGNDVSHILCQYCIISFHWLIRDFFMSNENSTFCKW